MRRPLAFAVLLLALSACTSERRSVPPEAAVLDDFEDGSLSNALGNPWQGVAEGNGTMAQVAIAPGGFATPAFHLVTTGFRPPDASGAQVVGVRTALARTPALADPNRAELTLDARNYRGLSLALRGTPGTYIVQIGTDLVEDFNYYNAYVSATGEWTRFEIPFSEFRQEAGGATHPFDGNSLTHVAVYANGTGELFFEVDDVALVQ